jgi:hypothetical protein
LKGSSEIEIPVVENLTFFNCAETGIVPTIKKATTRKGTYLIHISAPFLSRMPQRGEAAAKENLTARNAETPSFILPHKCGGGKRWGHMRAEKFARASFPDLLNKTDNI